MRILAEILELPIESLSEYERAMVEYEKNKHIYESETDEEWELRQIAYANEREGNLTGYDCKICLNRGYINFYNYDVGLSSTYECSCNKIRRSLRLIKQSGLEYAIQQKTFEAFKCENELQNRMKQVALSYLDTSNNWLLFAGQSGVGKTHLCTAICGVLLNKGVEVVYMTFRDDVPKLKRYATDDIKYSEFMNSWKECQVLYIDDLFKGKLTDADISIMFELIDYRSRNDLSTIISTELSPNDLLKKDEALCGRIIHQCGEFIVSIPKNSKNNYRVNQVKNISKSNVIVN